MTTDRLQTTCIAIYGGSMIIRPARGDEGNNPEWILRDR